jgi:uncharacterized membrane protein YkgB
MRETDDLSGSMPEPTFRLTPKEKALLVFSVRMQIGVFVVTLLALVAAFTAALEGATVAFAIGLGTVVVGVGFLLFTPDPHITQLRIEREREGEMA